jgi:DNA-binding XRE family transcriptional regulator
LITNKQIRNARKCCGYTQERMAAALDYPLGNYLAFESGEKPIPADLTAEKLLGKIQNYHKSIVDTLSRLVTPSGTLSK